MLLDDTKQCVYFGNDQVITYDQLDKHYEQQFQHPIWSNLPREIFVYDSMVRDTEVIMSRLEKEMDEVIFQPMLKILGGL